MSGGSRCVTGSFKGTGAQLDVTNVGMRPRRVHLTLANGNEVVWHGDMPDGAAHTRLAAGTGAYAATQGITPLANGFRLGTNAVANVSGSVTHYTCWD